MIVRRIVLKNWKNFQAVDVLLGNRVFILGPNASGKSNFLDVFRFLRDLAKPSGGLQAAIADRRGISKIRCLAARRNPKIEIEVELAETAEASPSWKYSLGIGQEVRGNRRPVVSYERVEANGVRVLDRPDAQDEVDEERLIQTHLEQVNANQQFRPICKFFETIAYLHLIPQILRHPEIVTPIKSLDDPFGRTFLERVAAASESKRGARFELIEKALRIAVPQLKELNQVRDDRGVPHLEASYEHWRGIPAKQREDQFSDGTLRLLALLWSLLEGDSLLLLEEPELSLNGEIVARIPSLVHRVQSSRDRQVLMSTHSADLLRDPGIGGEEVLLLRPDDNGTLVSRACDLRDVKTFLERGLSVAEAALPYVAPTKFTQMDLFG
jgi:predicted ATPase